MISLLSIASLGAGLEREVLISSFRCLMREWLKATSGEINIDIRKKFFTEMVVKHWIKVLREVVMASSLLVFKKCLHNAQLRGLTFFF